MNDSDRVVRERVRQRAEKGERKRIDMTQMRAGEQQRIREELKTELPTLARRLASHDNYDDWHEVTVLQRNWRGKVKSSEMRAGIYLGTYSLPGSWHTRGVYRLYLLTDGQVMEAMHEEPDDLASSPFSKPEPAGGILDDDWTSEPHGIPYEISQTTRRQKQAHQAIHKLRQSLALLDL